MRIPRLRNRFLSSSGALACAASLRMAPAARAGMIPDPIEAIGTSGLARTHRRQVRGDISSLDRAS